MSDLAASVRRSPFHRLLNIDAVSRDEAAGSVRLALDLRPDIWRTDGTATMHGGAIASLIDIAAAHAVRMVAGRSGATTALSVDYLRPLSGPRAEAVARVVRCGRTQVLVDIEVCDGDRLAAIGRARFALTEAE